jgi:hypothetical protein
LFFDILEEKSPGFYTGFMALSQRIGLFWHVTCTQTFMARKMSSPKAGRQNNAGPQALNRRNTPQVPALYLMQLRKQAQRIYSEPRRVRLQIIAEDPAETIVPVKVTFKD